jgi:polysaccharide biosynthesis protein PslA
MLVFGPMELVDMIAIDADVRSVWPSAGPGAALRRTTHRLRYRLLALLAMIDFITLSSGLLSVAWLYLGSPLHPRLLAFLPFILPIYYLVAIRQRAYRLSVVISGTRSTRRAILALLSAVLVVISVTFLVKSSDDQSRIIATVGSATSGALLIIGRILFARFAFYRLNGSPEAEIVLIDGFPPPEACTAFKIDAHDQGLTPDVNDPAMLDRIGSLIEGADRVIISCLPQRRAAWALALKGAGVNVEVLAPELDTIGAINTRSYHGTATALVASGPLNAIDQLIKRCFDLALSIPAVIVLLPLLMAIAVAIKLDSPGPVLFVQKRVGKGNRMFAMFKFRSMRSTQLDHNASKLTTRNDTRVTRIGRLLRMSSLDELPQLLNVINGDMSIVGPRPHATGALAGDALYWEVASHYWSRHAVKPGLTGLAQVRGFRGNTETGDDLLNRLQADLAYLDSWSIWRDMVLVMQTFRVLVHRNAF